MSQPHRPLEEKLRAHRMRLTPQRVLICRLLEGDTGHPSAEALHHRATAKMPTLSLRTIYAVLHELEEIGAVRSLDLGTGSTRYDPNPAPHSHVVCVRCGRVRDVDPHEDSPGPPALTQQGFLIESVDLIYRGMCEECRR